jgi:hypothetical protein
VQNHVGIEKHTARTQVLGERKALFNTPPNRDRAVKIEALSSATFYPKMWSGHNFLHVLWNSLAKSGHQKNSKENTSIV